jgi:hypothetical protein
MINNNLPKPSGCFEVFSHRALKSGHIQICRRHIGTYTQLYLYRLIYAWWYGADLNGWVIRHACDNPRCINPLHLKIGTQADNMHDRWQRTGKQRRQ